MSKRALITGISGQDGSYLSDLLLSKGYEVFGFVLRNELEDPTRYLWRLSNISDKVKLFPASLESYPAMLQAVEEIKPDECYHLAAQSFVSYSLNDDFSTVSTNITGTLNILSVIFQISPGCRFYFAGSSEMFGSAATSPQNEETPFHPRSVYGISKTTGYYLTRNYRDNYGMHASNGILYNHESPRRGFEYVTRKISLGAAKIKLGLADKITLGNLDSLRDWGYAKDFVNAMWLMLQQDQATDYVIATGETHTVREFCEIAFSRVGLDYHDHVIIDERFFRPTETVQLSGNATKARQELGWKTSVSFQELVEMMVDTDLSMIKAGTL